MTGLVRTLKSFLGTAAQAARTRKAPVTRLGMESLEAREVPSVTSVIVESNSSVLVRDPARPWVSFVKPVYDTLDIRVDGNASDVRIAAEGTGIRVTDSTNGYSKLVGKRSITKVEFNGGAGADGVRLDHPDLILRAWGRGGDDRLIGNGMADSLVGGDGNDYFVAAGGNDKVWGEAGDDWVAAGDGNDTLWGGAGSDTLYGGDGRDKLYGGDGRDYLNGQAGDDYLNGQAGDDSIFGGSGTDTFRRNLYFPGLNVTPPQPEDKESDRADIPQEVTGSWLTEVAEGDGPTDGAQAGSPTCSFLAALSSVAARTGTGDDLVDRIGYDAARDVYKVTLYPNGVRKVYEVNGDWTEGRDPHGALWVTLYQKAYLRAMGVTSRGGMNDLLPDGQWRSPNAEYQRPSVALQALTGAATTYTPIADASPVALAAHLSNGSVKGLVAGSKDAGTTAGVVADHAYRVVGVQNASLGTFFGIKISNPNAKVVLYNPWGHDAAGAGGVGFAALDATDDGYITLTWSQFKANFQGYTRAG